MRLFNNRMHVSMKYADQYLKQFPYGLMEHIGKVVTFVASSLIMYFILLSVVNDLMLFNVEITR